MKHRAILLLVLALSISAFSDDKNGGSNNGCDANNKGSDCHDPGPTPTPTPAPMPPTTVNNGGQGGNGSANSTATGGSVNNSGNSSSSSGASVSGSGNSSNRNTASGGSVRNSGNSYVDSKNINRQGQSSSNVNGASSSASNNGNGNGNGANNTTITTNVAAPKIPVTTAYAPTAVPTVPCALGYSGGSQSIVAGITGSFTRVDKTCQQLEVARSFAISGAREAYCKVMVTTKWARKAHVSQEDCMTQEAAPTVALQASPLPSVGPLPNPVVTNRPPDTVTSYPSDPTFSEAQPKVIECVKADNVCYAKLDDSILYLRHHPDSYIQLWYGWRQLADAAIASKIRAFLLKGGISFDRINTIEGDFSNNGVAVVLAIR